MKMWKKIDEKRRENAKKKGTNIDDIWQNIMKGIKTTYNKIGVGKKENNT